jgi:ATP-dependent DNA helicase RecQ
VRKNDIDALTCVPSLRSSIVADFARELANRLKLPFVQLLQKQGAKQQKEMENSNYQCRNAWDSFSVVSGTSDVPKRIILVDDIVDSGWTLTVCGYRLTQSGCEFVFPFALADSSENRSNQ